MYIAPGITSEKFKQLNLDDNNSPDWDTAVEIFNLRITSRYLEPVDLLIEKERNNSPIDRRHGFSILAIDCLLMETLQSFREGLSDTKGKSKDIFVHFLTQRKSFKEYFKTDDAKKFYYNIRCGILHQAEVSRHCILIKH